MRNRLLLTTTICGAAIGFGAMAFAEDASTVQEIVVTGSRIKSPNITSDAPIASVSSKEIKLEGTTTVENLLNSLPQVIGGQNLGQSIDSNGTATVSLRNLGANRTLVLIDGRRMNPGDPQSPYPDLNEIPTQLVQRVDVLTGGASAVYGADAVAGVVNFIMKKDFQGVQIDAQTGAFQDNSSNPRVDSLLTAGGYKIPGSAFDGQQSTISVIMGANSPDDKGNIEVYGTYFHASPVTQDKRDYSACGLYTSYSTTSSVYDTQKCFGSSNSAYGRFQATTNGAVVPTTTRTVHDNPNGTNTFVTSGVPGYNFNTTSYLQREDDRYNLGFFAHYKVNSNVELYSDFMFADDRTVAQFAPSGFFAGTGPILHDPEWQINCNNPFLSSQQATLLCGPAAGTNAIALAQIGYRFTSVPRTGDFTHINYKGNFGARGDIADGWSYDVNFQYGRATATQYQGGYASLTALQNALLVNPNGTCYSGGQCVPVNIFEAQSAGITQAAYNYVIKPGITTGSTTEQIATLDINGDLGHYGVKSPLAKDGLAVAVGTDYRRENLDFQTDAEEASGDLSGGGQVLPSQGSFNVYEAYAEFRVPLVQDLPFVKSITFNPAYRYSQYSSAGGTNTYKLDFDYAPTDDIRFRYSYNVAVRAPNINELYGPVYENLFGTLDPCSGTGGAALSKRAACLLQGATVAELTAPGGISSCPANQCSDLVGGNAALKPETATTYTYGFVLTPHWVPRLVMSVDYYNIKITNLITDGLGGPNAELNSCMALANPTICGLIHRDPLTGELYGAGYVSAINGNQGFLQTKGIDFAVDYSYPLNHIGKFGDLGRASISMSGTYLAHYVEEAYGPTALYPGSGTYDCAGLYGATCGTPLPHWRSKVRVSWDTPWNFTASVQWRYIGSVSADINSPNPLLNGGEGITDVLPSDARTGDVNYFDVVLEWKVKDRYTFRAGCNNIGDVQPPVSDSVNVGLSASGNGNTYPQIYDTLGRNIFVGVTADF